MSLILVIMLSQYVVMVFVRAAVTNSKIKSVQIAAGNLLWVSIISVYLVISKWRILWIMLRKHFILIFIN